jgi:MFS family permease
MFFGLVQFLVYVWQYSILEAGFSIWPGPLTASIVAVVSSRYTDRIGYRVMLPAGSAFFIAGSLWLMLFAEVDPAFVTVWIPSALLTGFGVGLAMPSLSSAAVRGLPSNRYAVGSAVNQTIRTIGSVFGVALAVAILGQPTPEEVLQAFDGVWMLLISGAAVAGVVSLFLQQPGASIAEPVTEAVPMAAPERATG